ncbi:MAG: hypothetical protein H7Y11_06540, partial [Armatimonadetes bacterium]|nr:hypothetical protein [Anaerolineae bacterium]
RDTLQREDRRIFTKSLLGLARGIVNIYQKHKTARSPEPEKLLTGTANPVSGLDLVRVLGGYFAEGKRLDYRPRTTLPTPLGDRTRIYLRDEILISSEVIAGVLRAIPAESAPELKSQNIYEAAAIFRSELTTSGQRDAQRLLATELQKLAVLLEMIGVNGDPKAVEDGALGDRIDEGRHRPRSALEYLRFVYGYHLTRG